METTSTAARNRRPYVGATGVTTQRPWRFFALSFGIHAVVLGTAWALWVAPAPRPVPAVISAAWSPAAELPPTPEPLPDEVPDVERPVADEVPVDDPPPLDPDWQPTPDVTATIGVTDARAEAFLRAPRGARRPRGVRGGSGDGAGTTRAIPPVAAPAPPPEPPPARIQPHAEARPPRAVAASIVRPEYPESARDAGVQGSVVLDVDVLADGTIGDVRVAQSSGSRVLDAAAIDAVRRWRFEPATDGVAAIAMTVRLKPISFRLE